MDELNGLVTKLLSITARYKGITGNVMPGNTGLSAEGMGSNSSTELNKQMRAAVQRLIQAYKNKKELDEPVKEVEGLLLNAVVMGVISEAAGRELTDELKDLKERK